MTDSKLTHTPEEWTKRIDKDNSNQYQGGKKTRRYEIKANGLLIATVWAEDEFVTTRQQTPTQNKQDANAALIAAAPSTARQRDELLAAIKKIEDQASQAVAVVSTMPGAIGDKLCALVTYVRNQARAAISDAEKEMKG